MIFKMDYPIAVFKQNGISLTVIATLLFDETLVNFEIDLTLKATWKNLIYIKFIPHYYCAARDQ